MKLMLPATALLVGAVTATPSPAASFTIEQVLSAPFASNVTASGDDNHFAWVSNQAGKRNIWVSDGSGQSQPVTHYTQDDGIDLYDLAFVPHQPTLLFTRGGDYEYPDKPPPNPAGLSAGVKQEVFAVDLAGRESRVLGEGHAAKATPDGKWVLFLNHGDLMKVALSGGDKPQSLFKLRGSVSQFALSPGGDAVAFVSDRGDHSFAGIYRFGESVVKWIDAGFDSDVEPTWAPDGKRIAFLRVPSVHDTIEIHSHAQGSPWSIRLADLQTGKSQEIFRASRGQGSVFYPLSSASQLMWSGEFIVFPSEKDGWQHLYSVPVSGGAARLLTPGSFEVEYATASAAKKRIVYASNDHDQDRRHLWQLDTDSGKLRQLTSGAGIETQPVLLGDGDSIAYLKSDASVTAHAALLRQGKQTDVKSEPLPADFPAHELTAPASVTLPMRAGIAAHGMLFKASSSGKHPAVIFMHGGPVRQMLAGWHYMDYYSNAYGLNQYLAHHGYVVLALNYRAGIGYGMNFREADNVGSSGASEYNDVLAAAEYLKSLPEVDASRIGLWGGSYGGYLTALGLARNSDIFKAGVDLHGVHDWHHWLLGQRDFHPLYGLDTPEADLSTAFAASPMSSVKQWRSPVLLIQGDDDHNVHFSESVRLAEALRAAGVEYEQLVFPDEIHGFLRHETWLRAYHATAEFLDRKL
jgi:dipeptidyl aminopeptidase/acylaminoacyl peptidase